VPVFAQGAKIKCRSLHFAYDSNPDKEVLHDINLEISPGTRASLVGISGSGKTSFAYLISRIHKNTSGEIYFNDILIQQFNPDLLRQQIAFVGNFGEIFTGSIRENILIGRENVSENHLNEVVDLVELRRDLNRFEQGLESELLSEGRNISLGQRQRILLARALVGKPQLLILDEAFSGMDEMTKLKVIDKLFDSAKPWTILNISHDPEVVVKTNHIFLLVDGRIIEAGLLDQLRASPGSEFIRLFPKLIL